jgi:hypothetical protein
MTLIPLTPTLIEQLQVGQILQKYSEHTEAEFRYVVHAIHPQRSMIDLAIPDDELPKKIIIAGMEVSGILNNPPVLHETFQELLIPGKWLIEQS